MTETVRKREDGESRPLKIRSKFASEPGMLTVVNKQRHRA